MASGMLSVLACLLSAVVVIQGDDWGYTEADGPSTWNATGYTTCGDGTTQSPIDISGSDTEVDAALVAITYVGYDTSAADEWTLSNTGHSLKVAVDTSETQTISAGGLGSTYDLLQFHIHFGSDEDQGSEHTINGVQYPMEVHFVHTKTDHGKDLATALASGEDDAVAVLGVLYEIGTDESDLLTQINANIDDIAYDDGTAALTPFDLTTLLPSTDDQALYARYSGSLTTPSCNEVVVWTVFNEPVSMTQAQFDILKAGVYIGADSDTDLMADNYRPVQDLNGRTISTSATWPTGSGHPGLAAASLLLAATQLLCHLW